MQRSSTLGRRPVLGRGLFWTRPPKTETANVGCWKHAAAIIHTRITKLRPPCLWKMTRCSPQSFGLHSNPPPPVCYRYDSCYPKRPLLEKFKLSFERCCFMSYYTNRTKHTTNNDDVQDIQRGLFFSAYNRVLNLISPSLMPRVAQFLLHTK